MEKLSLAKILPGDNQQAHQEEQKQGARQRMPSRNKLNPNAVQPKPFLKRRNGSAQPKVVEKAKHYIASCSGPILLTAPHSCQFKKLKECKTQKEADFASQRDHKTERHTASICIALSNEINRLMGEDSTSMILWGNAQEKKLDKFDLDPNYLFDHQLEHSPFHQGIHQFISNNVVKVENLKREGGLEILQNEDVKPLFHLDFHGKYPRKEWAGKVDVGGNAMEYYFNQESEEDYMFSMKLKQTLSNGIDEIYKGVVLGDRKLMPKADPNCMLHGFWNAELHTMTSQNAMLGVPTFQFEMEPELRENLATDRVIQRKWAKMIVELYKEMIVPFWQNKQFKVRFDANIAQKVQVSTFDAKTRKTLQDQFAKIDIWSKTDYSEKKNQF